MAVRILVVEDDPKLGGLLRRGLSENGNAADLASRGEDALWMAKAHRYDAIVLDVMLPGLDGFQTCARLRADGVWTPVLMLTARDAVEDRIAGLDSGADDYLTKPFSIAELRARLRAVVRRGALERPAILEVGDLRLDPATQQAWRGEVEVPLSNKEFALLELFMRRPGQKWCPATSCSSTPGTWRMTTARTSSPCTSGACARRSTARSGAGRSRPCAAPATACAKDGGA